MDSQAYREFLNQVLRAIVESKGDSQVVYRLLAANIEKLDNKLAQLLPRWWATDFLAGVETGASQYFTAVIGNFSNLIQEFPLGDKASNMEIAIAGHEIVLTVFTRDAFPQQWATTQYNVGIAYFDRIKGEKAQNLELAIAAFQNAISVRTRDAFPQDWASTQNNLGTAYLYRIKGEKAQNLELAIAAFQNAISVFTRDAFPQDWASTQYNLGAAYLYRILGEKAQNLELAIAAYQNAISVFTRDAFPQNWASTQYNVGIAYLDRILGSKAQNLELAIAAFQNAISVRTRDAFPQQWASTQNNLGAAYSDRILGSKAQNLELAIAAYENALSIYTRDAFPQNWAGTQNNLGNAYRNRILGSKAQNLELAIAAFQNAISVFTRDAFPQDWASTQNNLGAAYLYRILGSKAQNLELAIAAYQNAISVRTRDAFPQDWASTQNNLGNAYLYRILREKAQNLELAIAAYQNAISVFTRDAFPQDWAQTQNNLGIAYSNRILGSKAQNLELAIIAFQNAISVRTRDAFPQNHAETLLNLGIAYQDGKQYTLAHNTFESAIETVEFLRGEIGSGEESKRKQAEEWNQLYGRMVEVCLELGKDTQAIEYIERSKTRNLVELLAIRDLYPTGIISEDTRKQLQQLRKDIDIEKRRLAAEEQPNYTRINELRQRYNELYPFEFITFEQIQALLGLQTAIIQWYIFPDCFRVFIITRNHDKPIIWHSSAEDLEKLRNLTSYEYLKPYFEDKSRWRHDLNDKLQQLAKILHLDEIVALIPAQCKKIILIPHFYLHLLPLHALPLSKGEDFIDKFPQGVSYAPSCQLLQKLLVNKGGDTDFSIPTSESYSTPPVPINELAHLLAIQNPTGDLEFTDIEVETIAAAFHPRRILKKGEATKTALMQQPTAEQFRDAHWLHFSSHAQFNLTYPLQSRLQLAKSSADNETSDLEQDLTLEDILNLSLPNCRMVTLSACETGLIDISSIDEYIGLPSGFIRVGAATVVSSLWTVDDFSTALLMIKFYENLQTLTGNVAIALNQAQLWCRQATQSELWQWIDGKIDMDVQHKEKIQKRLQFYTPEQKPFKNASAWAAFCAIGQ